MERRGKMKWNTETIIKKKAYASMAHWGSEIQEKPVNTVIIVGNNLNGLILCPFFNKKLESLKGALRNPEADIG